jgi:hypothetical protein
MSDPFPLAPRRHLRCYPIKEVVDSDKKNEVSVAEVASFIKKMDTADTETLQAAAACYMQEAMSLQLKLASIMLKAGIQVSVPSPDPITTETIPISSPIAKPISETEPRSEAKLNPFHHIPQSQQVGHFAVSQPLSRVPETQLDDWPIQQDTGPREEKLKSLDDVKDQPIGSILHFLYKATGLEDEPISSDKEGRMLFMYNC